MEGSKPAEGSAEVSKRQAFVDSIRESHPDVNFDDDDALFDVISKDRESQGSKVKKYEEESKKLVDLFSADPRAAALFNAWKDGGNPLEYMLETFGDEFKAALDDPEQRDKFLESHKKWTDNVAKNKEVKTKADENLKNTFKNLEEYQKANNLSDEEAVKLFDAAHQLVLDGIENTIKPETFAMLAKALNYETALADAERTGEVRGLNTKIEEKLKKETPSAEVPPTLQGAGTGEKEKKPEKKPYNPFLA